MLIQILDKALECLAVIVGDRGKGVIHRCIVQRTGETADVILMGMCADDVVQMAYGVLFQIRINEA